jgi:hypothetical protein
VCSAALVSVAWLLLGSVAGQAAIPTEDSVSVVTNAPTTTNNSTTTSTTLPSAATTIAPGCPVPQEASVVFLGTVSDSDVSTVTFTVDQVRYGTLETVVVGAPVGVRYGSDVKYLDVGEQYLVAAVIDPASLQLSSTVRDNPDMFGGAAVAGAVEQGRCPNLEEAIRTLWPDGSSIESGVLTPFLDSGGRIAIAIILPAILGFVLLLALVWVKRGMQK